MLSSTAQEGRVEGMCAEGTLATAHTPECASLPFLHAAADRTKVSSHGQFLQNAIPAKY